MASRPAYRYATCPGCDGRRDKQAALCGTCRKDPDKRALAETVTAPALPERPQKHGDWLVCSDSHIPYHSPRAFLKLLEAQELLGITQLCIAGDFIHTDAMSKFTRRAKVPTLGEEMVQAAGVLKVLEGRFDKIVILPGNHDHRVEKTLAKMATSVEGAKGLEMIGAMLGMADFTPADLALSFFEFFFGSKKVEVRELSDLEINDTWLVQHPASCSRIGGQNERKMIYKHRKCIMQGHNHLFGVQYDDSGTDIGFNLGHMCDPSRFRYVRERPNTFPKGVLGFGAVLHDKENPEGYLLPLAVHDRWFDLAKLKERLTS
jgi:hypothetical protein